MNTTVKFFDKPQSVVSISNIVVDIAKFKFSLSLAYTLKGKRKAILQDVQGNITPELREWLCVSHPDKIKVIENDITSWVPTGTSSTGFQRFLARTGREFKPGILKELVFTSQNNSDSYEENPFKLILLEDKAILSLVNVSSKRKEEFVDPNTGEVTTRYSQKYFKTTENQYRKSFVTKAYFLRLIIQTSKSVVVAPETAPAVEQSPA